MAYNTLYPEIIFEVIADDQNIDIIINDVDLAIRPYDREARGLQQEPLFILEKKLYASSKYLEKYGEPKNVEELKNHYIVAQTDPKTHPYSDIHWILKLGIEPGEKHIPIFTSNSLECLIEAVKEGKGIISCYEEMKIVRNNGLKQILPSIRGETVTWYCTYSKSLILDKDFQNFKDYILKSFTL